MNKRTRTDWFLEAFFFLFTLVVLLPLWYVFVVSLSTPQSYAMDSIHLWPRVLSMEQYASVLGNQDVMRSLGISLMITSIGTCISMFLTIGGGYALSKKELPGRNLYLTFIIITMFFSGGLVPYYLLIRSLGMNNTYFALFIPTAINSFNLIVMKNHFLSFPQSLEESARIDGYNDTQILYKIEVPLFPPGYRNHCAVLCCGLLE